MNLNDLILHTCKVDEGVKHSCTLTWDMHGRPATREDILAAARQLEMLVIPTPWPKWVTDRVDVVTLEWLWAHQHIEDSV